MANKKRLSLRIPVIIYALCLLITGCGSSAKIENPGTPKPDTSKAAGAESHDPAVAATTTANQIEISFFISDPGQVPTPDNKIYKLIQEKLGVTCNFEFLVGDKAQKIGVMIAGGDYPDVVSVDTDSQEKWMSAGVLIPLEGLIKENCPNLQKHFEPVMKMASDPVDGHLYIMPDFNRIYGKYNCNIWQGPAFWIQKSVLAEFGYPKVQTLDKYFKLIEQYKTKYPTIDGMQTIGFEVLCDGWRDFCLKNPPQHLIGHPNDGSVVVDYNTNKAEFFRDKDYAKRYYEKLCEENAKGIIDPESFTMTYDSYMVNLSSGRVLGMFDQHWNFADAEMILTTENKLDRTWVPLPIVYDSSIKPYYQDLPVLNVNTGLAITKNCKNPVRVIQFFDALLTDEWQKILGWGIEGEDYFIDSSGMFYRNQEQRDRANDPTARLSNQAYTLWAYAPKMDGTFSDGNATAPGFQPKEFYDSLKDYDKEFLDHYGYQNWADFLNPPPLNRVSYPAWSIDLLQGSAAQAADARLNELGTKYLPRAILSDPSNFDSVWNEYVKELHKCDLNAYMSRIQDMLDWRAENWK